MPSNYIPPYGPALIAITAPLVSRLVVEGGFTAGDGEKVRIHPTDVLKRNEMFILGCYAMRTEMMKFLVLDGDAPSQSDIAHSLVLAASEEWQHIEYRPFKEWLESIDGWSDEQTIAFVKDALLIGDYWQ